MRIAALLLGLLILAGCTPEKAKSIRLAAEQFRNQALIAINAVEKAMMAELAPRPRSDQEQTDQFVDFLANLDLAALREADIELGFPNLEQAANPDDVELNPEVKTSRNRYLNGLRTRFSTFAGMLQGLEEGSFFVADELKRSNKLAIRLTADMAGIAKHFKTNPPRLIQQRGSLVADTLDILEDEQLSRASKKDRLALIKTRFDDLKIEEQKLLSSVLEPSLKAAEFGRKLHKMAAEYDRLSVSDMQDLLLRSISIAGNLTGRDMTFLTREADTVFAKINNDPVLTSVAEQVMSELNQVIADSADTQ